jgi:hypothetical protein
MTIIKPSSEQFFAFSSKALAGDSVATGVPDEKKLSEARGLDMFVFHKGLRSKVN